MQRAKHGRDPRSAAVRPVVASLARGLCSRALLVAACASLNVGAKALTTVDRQRAVQKLTRVHLTEGPSPAPKKRVDVHVLTPLVPGHACVFLSINHA